MYICMYMYMSVCVCVCVSERTDRNKECGLVSNGLVYWFNGMTTPYRLLILFVIYRTHEHQWLCPNPHTVIYTTYEH